MCLLYYIERALRAKQREEQKLAVENPELVKEKKGPSKTSLSAKTESVSGGEDDLNDIHVSMDRGLLMIV